MRWANESAPDAVSKAVQRDVLLGELDASLWEDLSAMTGAGVWAMVELVGRRTDEIGELPILMAGALSTDLLSRVSLSVRARNCLRNAGLLENPESLTAATFSDLLAVQGLGMKTALEIACVLEHSEGALPPGPIAADPNRQRPLRGDDESANRLLDAAVMLAAWAVAEHGVHTLGEAIRLQRESRPVEVNHLLEVVDRIDAAASGVSAELDVQFAEVMRGLGQRQRLIFARRTVAFEPLTLESVGKLLGVTRERIRQLERNAIATIRSALNAGVGIGLRWRAETLGELLGAAAPLSHSLVNDALERADEDLSGSESQVNGSEVLVWLAGPYKIIDGWALHSKREIGLVVSALRRAASSGGVLSLDDAAPILDDAGVASPYHEMWLEAFSAFRGSGDHFVDAGGHLEARAVRALHRLGKPSSIEEIVREVGVSYSIRSARNRLMDIEGIVRAGKNLFGLSQWDGVDEYTGISDEIAQEIDARGGVASLDHLMDVIPDRYGVAASSVRAYALAPRFISNDGGDIRVRSESDPPFESGESLEHTKSCFLREEIWMVRIRVDTDLLRGSGRHCPAAFAELVGVRPGTSKTLHAAEGVDTYIGWPETASLGPAFGSLREWALFFNLKLGDWLYLGYSGDQIRAQVVTDVRLEAIEGMDRLRIIVTAGLVDSVDDWEVWLPRSVGLVAGEKLSAIRERFRSRGDKELYALLPEDKEMPTTIKDSLSGLRDALDL